MVYPHLKALFEITFHGSVFLNHCALYLQTLYLYFTMVNPDAEIVFLAFYNS